MHLFIFKWFQDYKFDRKNVIKNTKIAIIHISYCSLIWLAIIVWVLVNNGHVHVTKQLKTITVLNMEGAFETNYSMDQFRSFVHPEELVNYNRPWDVQDYTEISSEEVHVLTNLVITKDQRASKCAENPGFRLWLCESNKQCPKGKTSAHGILTGRCIKSDFYNNHPNYYNRTTCEFRGEKI